MSLITFSLFLIGQIVFGQTYIDIEDGKGIGDTIAGLRKDGNVYLLNVVSDREFSEQIVLGSETLELKVARGKECKLSYLVKELVDLEDVKPVFNLTKGSSLTLISVVLKIQELPHAHEEEGEEGEDHGHEEVAGIEHSFIIVSGDSTVNLTDVIIISAGLDHSEITAPVISVVPNDAGDAGDAGGTIQLTRSNFTDLEFHESSFIVLNEETLLIIENSSFSAEETFDSDSKHLLGQEDEDEHDHEEAAWLIYMDEDEGGYKINVTISYTTFATVSIYEGEGIKSEIEVICLVGDSSSTSVCEFKNCTFKAFTVREADLELPHAPTFFHFINLNVKFENSKVIGTYGDEELKEVSIEHCWNDAIFYFANSIADAKGLSFENIQGGVYAVEENSTIYLDGHQFTNVSQVASQFHTAKKAFVCTDSKIYYKNLTEEEKNSLWIVDDNCTIYNDEQTYTPTSYLTVPSLEKVYLEEGKYVILEGKNLIPEVCQFTVFPSSTEEGKLDLGKDVLVVEKSNETHIVFDVTNFTVVPGNEPGWSAEVGYVSSYWCEGETPNYLLKTERKDFVSSEDSDSGNDMHLSWKGISLLVMLLSLFILM